MFALATIDDLLENSHTLGLYCIECDRWAEADLVRLAGQGFGSRQITGSRFRCSDCGGIAEKQVRPPVPQVGGAAAYIQP